MPSKLICHILAALVLVSLTNSYESDQTVDGTPDECGCERQTYSSNETSGEIKSPGYPDSVCNTATYCVYEIEANQNFELIVSLTVEIKSSYKLSIYETVEFEGRQIQLHWYSFYSVRELSHDYKFAKNVGARIVLTYDDTVTPEKPSGWGFKPATKVAFKASFNRVNTEVNCPFPLFIGGKEPKTVQFQYLKSKKHRNICNLAFFVDKEHKIKVRFEKNGYCEAKLTQIENNTEIQTVGFGKENNFEFTSETSEMRIFIWATENKEYCKCRDIPQILGDNSSTVTHLSPGFPYSFCPKLKCSDEFTNNLILEGASGDVKAFLLTWNDFQIENMKNDLQLDVKVEGGINTVTSIRFQSEGNKHILMGNKLTLVFKNIDTLGLHGYNVTIEAVIIPKRCLCSNTYIRKLPRHEDSQLLLLPADCRLIYCHYEIESSTSPNDELDFAWMNFQLASEDDKLTITEDNETKRSFTYNSGREDHKYFSQKNLVLSFERDERTKNINTTTMDSKIEIKWKTGPQCLCLQADEIATTKVHSIHSLNYPQPYCNNMNCIYNIKAEEGYRIVVNITELDIENYRDHLYFYDGNSTKEPRMEEYYAHRPFYPLVKSSYNYLTIQFKTDGMIVEKGFEILFWAEPLSSFSNDTLPSFSDKLSSSHLSIISILLFICLSFGAVIAVLAVILVRKRGSFTFLTTFRNPVFASPTIYYSDDNVSTRSFVSRREEQ